MNGQEIKDFAESILDESIEETLFLTILNTLKDRREEMREWMFLRKLDTTKSAITTAQSLPVDFRSDRKIVVGTTEYLPTSFEEQHLTHSQRYFIDFANSTFTLKGNPSGTVYFYYNKTTPELTLSTSPVWPERFHKLLAFDIAGYIMNGQDADDLFSKMSPENKGQAIALDNAMAYWDSKLQMKAQGDRIGIEGQGNSDDDNLGNM